MSMLDGDACRVVTLAERPDLRSRWRELDGCWPTFLHHAPNGLFFGPSGYEDYSLVAVTQQDEIVARAASVPFRLGSAAPPPEDGLDEAVRWAAAGRLAGWTPDAVASVEVAVREDARGQGLGARMLSALRGNARRHGFDTLLAPVRPVGKPVEPQVTLADYVARRRADGLPEDPWLRTHVRLGGEVVRLAPYSTVVPGTLAQWGEWTQLAFDRAGPVVVPGALVPVLVDLHHDYAVYVEPNVWVRHDLAT
jgi:GNAT superfamily N-acetyltransferase